MNVWTTLRNLREARDWTRAELARRAGMHPATVGQIEAGRVAPYPVQVAKLARALGVDLERLTGGGSADAR